MGKSVLRAAILVAALAGQQGVAQEASDLAKQLSNPVADLISVPLQFNFDSNLGSDGDIDRTTLNIQPVIPISLGADWNLISRTILPYIWTDGPGGSDSGFGDIVQSFFVSPKAPTSGGWIWGAGPVLLLPVGEDGFSGDTFGLGPTAVALRQQGPWTYGALANHIWSIEDDPTTDINQTFLQPFLSYTTKGGTSFTVNTESTYDWEAEEWSVPLFAGISQVTTIAGQPISLQAGLRYWVDAPETGPDGWAARAALTFLFPK